MHFSNSLSILATTAGAMESSQLHQSAQSSQINTHLTSNAHPHIDASLRHQHHEAEKLRRHSFRGIKKRFLPEDPSIRVIATDVGVLPQRRQKNNGASSGERFLQDSVTCDAGYIICNNGTAIVDGNTISCEAACDGNCCTGGNDFTGTFQTEACSNFNGKVCMDGSCNGWKSCNDATIDYVIGSCDGKLACEGSEILKAVGSCSGSLACRDSGRDSEVTYLKNSCKGDNACINNNMGIVVDSCHDYGSCSVSNIKERMENSCQGYQACGELGNYAIIGQVIDSCHGQDSCYGGWLPSWFRDSGMIDIRPNIGDIVRSCLDDRACYDTFGEGGPIKGIEDSCHGFESCTGIAAYDPTLGTRGNVGVVKNSCIGNQSCKDFGRGGGEQCVGDITYSCRSDNSCQGAFNNVHTTGPLTDCCNKPTVCAGVTSQPEECFSPSENLSCIPLEKVGNNGNPSGIFPLGPCQGDCDNDNECEGALVCFTRSVEEGNIGASVPGCSGNGGDASDDDDDFCTARPSSTYLAYIANGGVNQGAFPLKECEGDCDDDSECEGDLICFIRNQDTPEGGGLALVGGCQGLGVKGKDYCKRADA